MTGNILLRQEVQILLAMDGAYLSELHKEIKDIQARMST